MIKSIIAVLALAVTTFAQTGTVHLQGGSRLGYTVQNLSQLLPPADPGMNAIELTVNTRFSNAIFTEVTGPGYYETTYIAGNQWEIRAGTLLTDPVLLSHAGLSPSVFLSYWETDAFDGRVDWRGPTVHSGFTEYIAPQETIIVPLTTGPLWYSATMNYGSISSQGMAAYTMHHYLRNWFFADVTYRYLQI